jgi:DNA-directed RNA polymerase subunit RPC12/RpoP
LAIEFRCPRCQAQLTVPDEEAGKKQRCPTCQAKLRIPAPPVSATGAIEFQCPRCHRPLSVPAADAGRKQRCPGCHGKLRVPAPAVIEFLCPRCHKQLSVPASDEGQKQRCPSCRGKLRVPAPEVPPLLGAAIEFQCPRCKEPLTVPAANAGKKQRCPRCFGKLRVPVPAESGASSAQISTFPFARGGQGGSGEPASAIPAASDGGFPDWETGGDDDSGEYLVGDRIQHFNLLGLLIPVACVAILAAVAAWLLHKPEPKLEGTLAGERLTDIEFGPFIVDNRYLGRPKAAAREVFQSLEGAPLRATSQLLVLEFEGSSDGISVLIQSADGCEFYRVDPRSDRTLSKYLAREKGRLAANVENVLKESVPEFVRAIENRPEGGREVPGLAEFRNSVGLAALVQGFGHHVQAVIDRQIYPCVHEDDDGRLYFSLPVGTQEFEFVGREESAPPSRENPPFPGHYKVSVAKEPVTVNKKKLDPKERVRELLKQ